MEYAMQVKIVIVAPKTATANLKELVTPVSRENVTAFVIQRKKDPIVRTAQLLHTAVVLVLMDVMMRHFVVLTAVYRYQILIVVMEILMQVKNVTVVVRRPPAILTAPFVFVVMD
jgi:hypothetical protein